MKPVLPNNNLFKEMTSKTSHNKLKTAIKWESNIS